MNDKQLKILWKAMRLSDEERARIRLGLVTEMKASGYAVPSPFFFGAHTKKIVPLALLGAILCGGTVSFAAENTTPGDALYPIKIHVNEKMRGALALTNDAKASLEAELAEKRLKEAEELKSEDRLTNEKRAELRERFIEHEQKLEDRVLGKDNGREGSVKMKELKEKHFGSHRKTLADLGIEDDSGDDEGGGSEDESGDDHGSQSQSRDVIDTPRDGASSSRQETRKEERKHEEQEDDDSDKEEWEYEDEHTGDAYASQRGNSKRVTVTSASGGGATSTTATYDKVTVAIHNTKEDCYVIVENGVYDITSYISVHKGGAGALVPLCGTDATTAFSAQHGGQGAPARALASLQVGTVK